MPGLALLVSLLALAACGQQSAGNGTGGTGAADRWPAGRTFRSTSVTEQAHDRPLVTGSRIELRFFQDGRLDAQAGCNHLGGQGRLDGDRLVVTDQSTTDMGCDPARMAQDKWLSDFLGARPQWRLAGDELVLRDAKVEIRLTDRKVTDPDRQLVGTRWQLDTLTAGDVVSSVPAGEAAELQFDGHGFRGSTGCSKLSGVARPSDGKLLLSAVHQSRPSCTGRPSAVDTAVLAVLHGPVAYRIEGPYLTLTGRQGQGLRLRAAG